MFIVVFLVVWTALHAYVWRRTSRLVRPSPRLRTGLLAALTFLALSYVAGRILEGVAASAGRVLEVVGAWWMGMLSLVMCLLVAAELASLVTLGLTAALGRARTLWRLLDGLSVTRTRIIAASAWMIVLGAAVYGAVVARYGVAFTHIRLETPELPQTLEGKRLVQVTDMHLGNTTTPELWQSRLDDIARLNPDVLVITGDLIDDDSDRTGELVAMFAKQFDKLPRYAIEGNHEQYVGTEFFHQQMREHGFHVLRQQSLRLGEGVFLAGVDDARFDQLGAHVNEALSQVPAGASVILLAHRPVAVDFVQQRARTLVLSGHVHGGQIPPFTWLSPAANRGYRAGLYERGAALLYTCLGTGSWGPPMRLFAPPEIVTIELVQGPTFRAVVSM